MHPLLKTAPFAVLWSACGSNASTPAAGKDAGSDVIVDLSADSSASSSDAQVIPDASGAEAGPVACGADAGVPDGFHVAPAGSAGGDGTAAKPWDLATALAEPSAVKPGALIWLHGGTYAGSFASSLTGTAAQPIVVRGYPGEHAVIDGGSMPGNDTLTINGGFTTYRDFELTNSGTERLNPNTGSAPAGARGAGINVFGPSTRLVDLVVHDAGVGIGDWTPASDAEVYGCIIFYNGWDAPDRGHGHAIYVQGKTGIKHITDNVLFRQFSFGLHGYTEQGNIDNILAKGNISFDNGELSKTSGFATNLLIGGLQIAQNPTFDSNTTYFPGTAGANELGFNAGTANATVTNNYFAGGRALSVVNATGVASISGNVFYGTLGGVSATTYPNNTYATTRPTGAKVFVRPNSYEPGRAHVAVYNWDGTDTVPVDLSNVLAAGDPFEVRDVQDLFGAPVLTATYSGTPVPFPMKLTAVTKPVGDAPVVPAHTSSEFGAFLVRRLCR